MLELSTQSGLVQLLKAVQFIKTGFGRTFKDTKDILSCFHCTKHFLDPGKA